MANADTFQSDDARPAAHLGDGSDRRSAYSRCAQCPRVCKIDRAREKGFCGESDELRVASACLHFGEEPPITVFGGSGTIFFTGCTLRCAFCQNYQISQNGMGRAVSENEFVNICLALEAAGAENINLVTGSHHIPKIATYLAAAKNAGVSIPFCWNSSAYESVETLERLRDLVSIWLPDLKTLSPHLAQALFAARDYPDVAKRAISWMINNFSIELAQKSNAEIVASSATMTGLHYGDDDDRDSRVERGNDKSSRTKEKIERGVIVRHLFLPGHFAETADALEWLKKNADGRALISLMSQYTPVPFDENAARLEQRRRALSAIENRLVSKTEDADLRDLIDAYDFEHLFYQELSDDESWLPDFARTQPFSNALAKPVWHWTNGFITDARLAQTRRA